MDYRITHGIRVYQTRDANNHGQVAGDSIAVGLIDPCGFGDRIYLAQAGWTKAEDVQGMAAEANHFQRRINDEPMEIAVNFCNSFLFDFSN